MSPCFIIDDHLLFAQSFACLLRSTGIFSEVLPTNFKELPQLIPEGGPVPWLFTDYLMPGINVQEELRSFKKKGLTDIVIVLVSSVGNPYIIRNMLQEGCKGYLTKGTDEEELVACINAIEKGNTYVTRERHDILLQQVVAGRSAGFFTKREMEMLPFLVNGSSIEEMASLLRVSTHTIINHRRHMMSKAGVKSVTALVKVAMEMGLC